MITNDVQKLTPGDLVVLYELDATKLGGDVLRFHPDNTGPIVWQGNTYEPWAITASNFERTGNAQQPNPTVQVGNIGVDQNGESIAGVIGALCLALDDLRGAKFTRKRTFKKHLDGQPEADPNMFLPDEVWTIKQKSREVPEQVDFVLGSPLSMGKKLPSREIIAGLCGWMTKAAPEGGYRGAYCGYTGPNMFDKDGNPVTDPTLDKCGGRVSDCKLRFGEWEPLRFGGYPLAGRA